MRGIAPQASWPQLSLLQEVGAWRGVAAATSGAALRWAEVAAMAKLAMSPAHVLLVMPPARYPDDRSG